MQKSKMNVKIGQFLVLLTLLTAQSTSANWLTNIFSEAEHWVEKEYNEARRLEKELEKNVEEAAIYVAEKTSEEIIYLADEAIHAIETAATELEHLVEKTFNVCNDGTPPEALKALAEELNILNIDIPGLPKQLEFIKSPECGVSASTGFACGIFPYVTNIISAIVQGSADAHHISVAVGKAYNDKHGFCAEHFSSTDPIERGACAIVYAAVSEAQKSVSCIEGVINKVAHGTTLGGTGGGTGNINTDQICFDIGNFAFGSTMDSFLAGMVPDKEKRLAQLVEIARKLETRLNKQSSVSDSNIQKACNERIIAHTQHGRIPSEKISILNPVLNPGKDLKLMTNLKSSPLCLDVHPEHGRVHAWHCKGNANQRWDFKATGKTYAQRTNTLTASYKYKAMQLVKKLKTEGYTNQNLYHQPIEDSFLASPFIYGKLTNPPPRSSIYIVKHSPIFTISNEFNGKCLSIHSPNDKAGKDLTDGFAYVNNCDENNVGQQHIITDAGALTSLHAKTICLDMPGSKQWVKYSPCDDHNSNQKIYYSDPSVSLLKGAPGKHRQLWNNPSNPLCLDYFTKQPHYAEAWPCNDTGYQSWSFTSYKTFAKKYTGDWYTRWYNSPYYQIRSDNTADYCLQSDDATRWNGSKVTFVGHPYLATCKVGLDKQMYKILPGGRLQNRHTEQCLSLQTFVKGQKTHIYHNRCNDDPNQQWHLFAK